MSEGVEAKSDSEDVMVKQGNSSFKVSKSIVCKYVALLFFPYLHFLLSFLSL